MEVQIAIAGQLRQVGHAQHLVIAACDAISDGQAPQLLADHAAHPPADAGVNLVKDEGRRAVGLGQHRLEGQHQARGLAAGGDAHQRLERLADVGRDQELDPVQAGRVKGHPPSLDVGPVVGIAPGQVHAKAGAVHAQFLQLGLDAGGQPLARLPPLR